jgi:hypothetical protein
MLHNKPVSVERARMQYFQAVNAVNFATNEIERDKAKSTKRRATQTLQNSQRIERNFKASVAHAKTRRRHDWNVALD